MRGGREGAARRERLRSYLVEGRAALKRAELDNEAGPQLHQEFLIQPHVAWHLPHVTEREGGREGGRGMFAEGKVGILLQR